MTTTTTPGFGIVLRQQMRLLWLSRRPQLLAALMVGSFLMMRAVVWWTNTRTGSMTLDAILFTQVTPLIMAIGGAWGIIVWRDDPPKHRRYHWSLPVDMTHHDLARVLAGALWLLAAIAVYFAVGSMLALADGTAAELRHGAGFTALHYALAPLLAYMLMSGFGVASNRPFEWALGLFFGLQLFVALAMVLDRHSLIVRFFESAVFTGSWGLGAALSGWGPGSSSEGGGVPAVLLWLAIGTVLVALAAVRRRGRA